VKAPDRSGRKKLARLTILAALAVLAVVLFPWTRCRGMFGLGGEGGNSEESTQRPRPVASSGTGTSVDAGIPRCELRLDAAGLHLSGRPATHDAVLAGCRTAGAADVVVTGDAAQGAWDELRALLAGAGIKAYVRGAPDTPAADGGGL